jgi:hypothetical protein
MKIDLHEGLQGSYVCITMNATGNITNNASKHYSTMPSPNGSPYTHTTHTSEPALREAGSHFKEVCMESRTRLVENKLTTIIVSNNSLSSVGRRLEISRNTVSSSKSSSVCKHAQQERKKKCD